MERESNFWADTIKFRGYDLEKGWVYGDLVHNQKITLTGLEPRIMVGGYEVDKSSIGMFTGFFYEDGTEVYEGDIIKYSIIWNPDNDIIFKTSIIKRKNGAFFAGNILLSTCFRNYTHPKLVSNIYERNSN